MLAPLSKSLARQFIVQTGSPLLLVGLFGGIIAWAVGFSAPLVVEENRVDAFAPLIAGVSTVVLGGFGVYFLVDAAQRLFV